MYINMFDFNYSEYLLMGNFSFTLKTTVVNSMNLEKVIVLQLISINR